MGKILKQYAPLYRQLGKSVQKYEITITIEGAPASGVFFRVNRYRQTGLAGKVSNDPVDVYKGVNIGKANETTPLQQAVRVANTVYQNLRHKGYTDDLANVKEKSKLSTDGVLLPMLAKTYSSNNDYSGWLWQYKYNGLRVCVQLKEGELFLATRKGIDLYPVPHIRKAIKESETLMQYLLDGWCFDGELYAHEELLQDQVSWAKVVQPETKRLKLVVFDMFHSTMSDIPALSRFEELEQVFDSVSALEGAVIPAGYNVLPKRENAVRQKLEQLIQSAMSRGYEGLILRDPDAVYQPAKRSSGLVKYKKMESEEFEVLDVVSMTGKFAGLGKLILRCGPDQTFDAVPEGDEEFRRSILRNKHKYIGKMYTVEFQGRTKNGVPIFPVGITVRDYE